MHFDFDRHLIPVIYQAEMCFLFILTALVFQAACHCQVICILRSIVDPIETTINVRKEGNYTTLHLAGSEHNLPEIGLNWTTFENTSNFA